MPSRFRYQTVPHIIAHRCNDPESVNAVVKKAGRGGVYYMECDVRTTADGVMVAQHDPEDRDGRLIAATDYAVLKNNMMRLEDLLAAIADVNIILHLDVKADKRAGHWVAAAEGDRLFDLLESRQIVDRVIVTAVAGDFLRYFRKRSPKIKLGVLYDEDYGSLMPPNKKSVNQFVNKILEYHHEIVLDGIFLNQQWLQVFEKQYKILDTFFYTIQKAGIKIAVWTVNDPAQAKRFVTQGAEWITTDGKVRPKDLKNG